jgi:hypothetical protein
VCGQWAVGSEIWDRSIIRGRTMYKRAIDLRDFLFKHGNGVSR